MYHWLQNSRSKIRTLSNQDGLGLCNERHRTWLTAFRPCTSSFLQPSSANRFFSSMNPSFTLSNFLPHRSAFLNSQTVLWMPKWIPFLAFMRVITILQMHLPTICIHPGSSRTDPMDPRVDRMDCGLSSEGKAVLGMYPPPKKNHRNVS